MTKIISIVNQKGGVAKTTTTANLGAALASQGFQVLLLDLDSQCNLTQSLVGDLEPSQKCIASAIQRETSLDNLILKTKTPGLFLVPAGEEMTGLDLELVGKTARERVLDRVLSRSKLGSFDFILIDTAPYISLVTVNSLTASDYYLVPTTAEYLPLRGIERLTRSINEVREILNSKLSLLGVLLTQYDTRKSITQQIETALKEELGELLFQTRIRINTRFSSSPINQETIFQYEATKEGEAKGTDDYTSLGAEVLSRLGFTIKEAANG